MPAVITTAPPTKVRRKASLRARMTSLPGRRIRPSRAPGGDGGIRTLDRALQPYNGLANRRLQPLGHISAARRDSRPPDMPDARAHCKTRAQPRGYRALWPNRILRASSSVERSAFHRPGTSTTRALPALDPTDARLVARQTLVHDAEQAIDLVRKRSIIPAETAALAREIAGSLRTRKPRSARRPARRDR
jgi:hypothetical protein